MYVPCVLFIKVFVNKKVSGCLKTNVVSFCEAEIIQCAAHNGLCLRKRGVHVFQARNAVYQCHNVFLGEKTVLGKG